MERVPIYIVLLLLITSIFHSSFDNGAHASFLNSNSPLAPFVENQFSTVSADCPLEHHASASGNHCCHHIPAFVLPNLFRFVLLPVDTATYISPKVLLGILCTPLRRPPKYTNVLV